MWKATRLKTGPTVKCNKKNIVKFFCFDIGSDFVAIVNKLPGDSFVDGRPAAICGLDSSDVC